MTIDINGIIVPLDEEPSLLQKCLEPNVWVPVAMAIAGFLVHSWIRMIFTRREESRRAVTYLREISEEVGNGVRLIRYWYEHGGTPMSFCGHVPMMTTQAWKGFSAIVPDDIYQRILNVSFHTRKVDAGMLRTHLKNYYICICGHYERVVNKELAFNAGYFRNDVDGAEMVKTLIEKCIEMMNENANRWIWPW